MRGAAQMGLGGNKIEKCELKATSARLWITGAADKAASLMG